MSRSAFDAHTDPLFKNLKILNLESIYKLQIGKFMYQYRSGLLPYSFNNMFLVTRQVHSYGTRSLEHYNLPQCRTTIMALVRTRKRHLISLISGNAVFLPVFDPCTIYSHLIVFFRLLLHSFTFLAFLAAVIVPTFLPLWWPQSLYPYNMCPERFFGYGHHGIVP